MSVYTSQKNPPSTASWDWVLEHLTPPMQRALEYEAYRVLNNHQDIADVIQESLIKAVLFLYQLKSEEKLFSWLFTIVRREAYAYLSKQSSYARVQIDPAVVPAEDLASDANWLNNQAYTDLWFALQDLDARTKRIIMMRVIEFRSIREIAQAMDLNYSTARSRYTRALHRLRKRLSE